MATDRTITVTLKFSQESLNKILQASHYGDNEPPTVKKMTDEQFAEFSTILKDSADSFVEEIVDGSSDDGDWLLEFMRQFDY